MALLATEGDGSPASPNTLMLEAGLFDLDATVSSNKR